MFESCRAHLRRPAPPHRFRCGRVATGKRRAPTASPGRGGCCVHRPSELAFGSLGARTTHARNDLASLWVGRCWATSRAACLLVGGAAMRQTNTREDDKRGEQSWTRRSRTARYETARVAADALPSIATVCTAVTLLSSPTVVASFARRVVSRPTTVVATTCRCRSLPRDGCCPRGRTEAA